MDNKDPKVFLGHIKECIAWIKQHVGDITEEEFYENVLIQDGVIRRLEIIGEAVKNVPEEFRQMEQEIPWKKIAGFRDVLIHEYFDVDIKEVWNTIQTKLDELEKAVDSLLKQS